LRACAASKGQPATESDTLAKTTPSAAGQGIGGALIDAALLPDPIDRVTDNYAITYTNWLTRYEPADTLAAAR
jgi:hypothetical protein